MYNLSFKIRPLFYSLFLSILLLTPSMCAEAASPFQEEKNTPAANGNYKKSSTKTKQRSQSQARIYDNSTKVKNRYNKQIDNNLNPSEDPQKQESKINEISKEYQKEIEGLNSELEQNNIVLEDTKQKLEDKTDECFALKEELNQAREEIGTLKEEIGTLEQGLNEKTESLGRQKEELESIRKAFEELSTFNSPSRANSQNSPNNEDDSRFDQYPDPEEDQKQLAVENNQLQKLQNLYDLSQQECNRLMDELEEKNREITDLNKFKEQVTGVGSENSALTQRVQVLEGENQELMSENQDLNTALQESRKIIRNMEEVEKIQKANSIRGFESSPIPLTLFQSSRKSISQKPSTLHLDRSPYSYGADTSDSECVDGVFVADNKSYADSDEDDLDLLNKNDNLQGSISQLSKPGNSRPSVPASPISRNNSLSEDTLQDQRASYGEEQTSISDLQAKNRALDTKNKELTKSYNNLQTTFIVTTSLLSFCCFISFLDSSHKERNKKKLKKNTKRNLQQ